MELDAELRFEGKLRTRELDEEARTRHLYKAEMRRISIKKTKHLQVQLDLLDNVLPQSHADSPHWAPTHLL